MKPRAFTFRDLAGPNGWLDALRLAIPADADRDLLEMADENLRGWLDYETRDEGGRNTETLAAIDVRRAAIGLLLKSLPTEGPSRPDPKTTPRSLKP